MRCTSTQIEQFEADGFIVLDRVISPDEVTRMTEAMARVYRGEYNADRRPPRVRKPIPVFGNEASVHSILNARVLDQALWDLATNRELGEIAASLLRADSVSIVEDQVLEKPGPGLPVNMHQDRAYWPFSRSDDMVSGWIALVDMTEAIGTISCVRGSHRWGLGERPHDVNCGSESEWMAALEPLRPKGQELDIVSALVPAGGAIFWHSLTFHGSRRNLTNEPRRALALHWAGNRCTVDLAQTAKHNFPYFFARLADHGPIVNNYMPIVYP